METEIRKWGGSKAVILPEWLTSRLAIEVGDIVEVEVVKKGKISGFGRFPHAKPFLRETNTLEREF